MKMKTKTTKKNLEEKKIPENIKIDIIVRKQKRPHIQCIVYK